MAERDMRTWEQLTPAERRARLQAYDKQTKAEVKSRMANMPAEKPKKKGGDMLVNVYTLVKSRNKVIDKRVNDAQK